MLYMYCVNSFVEVLMCHRTDLQNCKSEDNLAVCTCFSIECASYNGNRPIRYCEDCDRQRHLESQQGMQHIYHRSIPDIWDCNMEVQRYLTDGIVR